MNVTYYHPTQGIFLIDHFVFAACMEHQPKQNLFCASLIEIGQHYQKSATYTIFLKISMFTQIYSTIKEQ